MQVFLLCGSSLVAVDRAVRVADGATDARRVLVAQGLMDELTREPTTSEREAGLHHAGTARDDRDRAAGR